MSDSHDSRFLDDPEFQSLLVGCLESLQRGETIDRNALATDFPKYAKEIAQFLDDQQLLEQVASDFGDAHSTRIAIPAYANTMDSGANPKSFRVGETVRYIGEYEILDEIARGGMGVVFKARQQKLNRVVALKMILTGRLADTSDVERFQREARAAGRLKHPNIVPVYEIGEHDGRHYFTMDFVVGRSLAEQIRDETLAPQAAAELVRSTAEAVQYAHEQDTIHRDLKPSNVLLDPSGQPKVTDFGLAKMLGNIDDETRVELTASGQVLGTPSYMSPEQASGKQELVGPASDIYSLGAILYASLTGRAPFEADSPVDTLLQVMNKEPVSPRELNPSIPRDLETICLKCLTKEPHKRYDSAQELADDLRRFLEGRPVVARPVGRIGKSWRWAKRNPSIATLSTLSVVLMVALALSVGSSFKPIIEEVSAETRRSTVDSPEKTETRLAVIGSRPALTGELVDGSDFDWSKYRGKIVLVDFWATWCAPCVAEIPNLKEQLAFYGDRGFDIVSINLDSDRAKLAEFLKDNKIEWANLYDEEIGRSHPIAKKYSIQAIPTSWLVDREGKVINLNARGHTLDLELARMIGPRSGEAGELAVNGKWAEASEAMKRFVAKHDSAKHVKGLVVAQILAGDLEGYRATCNSLWQQIDQRGPYDQANIVIFCSLLPDSGVAPEKLMEVADALLGKMWNNNFSVALAMASYRAGDYERCDARLKSDASPLQQFEDTCFTSMAAHRLGRRGQAARQLATAKKLFAQHFSSIDGYRTGRYNSDHWMNCALAQIVLNEAQSLLHAHPTNLPSKETPTVAPQTEAPVDTVPRALKD